LSEDGEDIQQELQESHANGGGESSSLGYDWSRRYKLLGILEGSATSQAQEGAADSVETRMVGTLACLGLIEKKMGKLWTLYKLHLTRALRGTNGLEGRVAGVGGEQSLRGLNHGRTSL
jgi:hypothetical protein